MLALTSILPYYFNPATNFKAKPIISPQKVSSQLISGRRLLLQNLYCPSFKPLKPHYFQLFTYFLSLRDLSNTKIFLVVERVPQVTMNIS